MNKRVLLLLVLASLLVGAAPPSGVWRTPDGAVLHETDARRSVQGFGVWLVATPDADWQEKWNTPSSVVPHFTEGKTVARGGKLTILIFFSNPRTNSKGSVNVACDITVTRPDGSLSVNAPNLSCLEGPLLGPPSNLRLGAPVIVFVAEAKDQAGTWHVQVAVKDLERNITVPVRTSFMLFE